MKTGNLYHLHYERLAEVNNSTVVHTISTSYAPSAQVRAYCYYQQTSGYAPIRMTVYSDGNVQLTAVTYNEKVAGVFDAYWTRT